MRFGFKTAPPVHLDTAIILIIFYSSVDLYYILFIFMTAESKNDETKWIDTKTKMAKKKY